MSAQHTPGPWYADSRGDIWRRNPIDLYRDGGGVAGDKPLATAHKGWHDEGCVGYPVVANARLIAAAPELLQALAGLMDACGVLRGTPAGDTPAEARARAAYAKATGGAA
jgi:hypothetical protein